MKNIIILAIIIAVSFSVTAFLTVNSIVKDIEKKQNKYKSEIGKKIVIENDTVTIVNYSIIMESFTLSNDQTVDCNFVFKNDSLKLK